MTHSEQQPTSPPNKRIRKDDTESSPNEVKTTNGIQLNNYETLQKNDIISSKIFQNEESILKQYNQAKPYSHGVLESIFVDGFLEKVLLELKQNFKAKFKESDLFRVYQSIDLGNLNHFMTLSSSDHEKTDSSHSVSTSNNNNTNPQLYDPALIPNLLKLQQTLYSPEYRSFMERIANLEPGTLIDKVDCAVNCHNKGCHLLCHDDVIGTRKVSYIIYLTDPAPEWKDEDGGRLELYDSVEVEDSNEHNNNIGQESSWRQRAPEVIPCKTILPVFNTMAYFVVKPGVSFHSVQEVFCDRPRLSIQGWYHAKEAPIQIEQATLSRLKSTDEKEDTEGEFVPISHKMNNDKNEELTSQDIAFLTKYINPLYLETNSINDIRRCFEDDSSVQLRHFLNEEWEERMTKYCIWKEDWNSDDKSSGSSSDNIRFGNDHPALNYEAGVNQDWKLVGPAHKQRYLEYVGNDNDDLLQDFDESNEKVNAGSLLSTLKRQLFQSESFSRFLKSITSLGMPLGYRGRVRRFRPGLDYTVAHYGILTQESVLDATMCFVAGSGNQVNMMEESEENDPDALWQSDDKGGFECYIAADDDEDDDDDDDNEAKNRKEAADEYNDEDDTKLLSVSASNNTLSLVYRDPGTMRFVKYVGIGAPSSRWDISLEYELPEMEEEDDDYDDDDENDHDDCDQDDTTKD